MSDTAVTRNRPGPARALAEADILQTALQVLDEGGAAGLSLRAVAAAVGVTPGALYTYFPTKLALVRRLVDTLLGQVDLTLLSPEDADLRGGIRAFALSWRAVLLAHPGIVPLLLGSPFDGPHALAAGERLLDVLVRQGLTPDDAARASYLLTTYVLGTVALDVAELEPGAPAVDEATRTGTRREALGELPANTYPHTAATSAVVAAYNSTEQFLWGLDRLLAGVLNPP